MGAEKGTGKMSVVNEKVLIVNNLLFLEVFMKIKSHQGFNCRAARVNQKIHCSK